MFKGIVIYICLIFCLLCHGKKEKIVGGISTTIEECPYLASLRRTTDNEHICSGTIIGHRYILTTAHCVTEPVIVFKNIKVHVGATDTSGTDGNWYLPEKYFAHPMFTMNNKNKISHKNDIAVIRLYGYIEFNKFQSKLNLPTTDALTADLGVISGWGATTYPSNLASNILLKTWMTIIDRLQCNNYVPFDINDDQICAFQKKGVGPCIGDSGSPLVKTESTIMGILIISVPCATGVPDLYTNVYKHIGFIKSILRDED